MTGIVTYFNEDRGFGFLRPLIGLGPDAPCVYFHVSSVRKVDGHTPAIPKDAEVRFKLVRGSKGPQAADVELVELHTEVLGRGLERKRREVRSRVHPTTNAINRSADLM
jgi:cold shock CspA family protein